MTPIIETSQTKRLASNTTSCTVTKPSGTVEGDLMVAFVGKDDDPSISEPSGWTQVRENDSGVDGPRLGAYYKVAGSGEPADYTWTADSENWYAIIYRVSGFDTGNIIDVSDLNTGGAAPKSGGPITTTVDNCLILTATAVDIANSSAPITLHADLTAVVEDDSGGAGGITFGSGWDTKASAGSYSEKTHGINTNERWIGIILAVAPEIVVASEPSPWLLFHMK